MSPRRTNLALPSISDYVDAIRNPYGRLRTLEEFEAQTDARGDVMFFAGNNAAVFPVMYGSRKMAVKCYIKPGLHQAEIYSFVGGSSETMLTKAALLRDELYVFDNLGNGGYFDIALCDWVEGLTLESAIRRASREGGERCFRRLSQTFDALGLELLQREWAHGDLKPENIVIRCDGSMCLIDYDAMFIPALTGRKTIEVGTPNYQHPLRDETMYDRHLDDYPIALISTCLRALALDVSLYERYNKLDNILLYPDQILSGKSRALDGILSLFARHDDHASYRLATMLRSSSPRIEGLAEALSSGRANTVGRAADTRATYAANPPQPLRSNGLWGYADNDGNYVIPAVYENASAFSEGLASVKIHGILKVIDTCGNIVINCDGIDKIKPFSESTAAVLRNGRWGFMDTEGRIIIEPVYQMAGSMREGLALVRKDGRYGFVDRRGRIVIDPIYEYATGFMNGRATVCLDGKTFDIKPDGTAV